MSTLNPTGDSQLHLRKIVQPNESSSQTTKTARELVVLNDINHEMQEMSKLFPTHRILSSTLKAGGLGMAKGVVEGAFNGAVGLSYVSIKYFSDAAQLKNQKKMILGAFFVTVFVALDVATWVLFTPMRLTGIIISAMLGAICGGGIAAYQTKSYDRQNLNQLHLEVEGYQRHLMAIKQSIATLKEVGENYQHAEDLKESRQLIEGVFKKTREKIKKKIEENLKQIEEHTDKRIRDTKEYREQKTGIRALILQIKVFENDILKFFPKN